MGARRRGCEKRSLVEAQDSVVSIKSLKVKVGRLEGTPQIVTATRSLVNIGSVTFEAKKWLSRHGHGAWDWLKHILGLFLELLIKIVIALIK